jgi:glutamine synthetase
VLRRGQLGSDHPGVGPRQPHVRLPHRRSRRFASDRDAHPGRRRQSILAFAAIVAAGLHGVEHRPEPPPALAGNAYESDAERFPHTLRDAIAALEEGTMARAAFGDQVVDHYLNYARTQQALFDKYVTDWERKRYFERG